MSQDKDLPASAFPANEDAPSAVGYLGALELGQLRVDLAAWDGPRAMHSDDTAHLTHDGVVLAGRAQLYVGETRQTHVLTPGQRFHVIGPFAIEGGRGFVISRPGRHGPNVIGQG